jgi:iron complex outermembrane receptor protein
MAQNIFSKVGSYQWAAGSAIASIILSGAILPAPSFARDGVLEEVIVTARKRAEDIQDVPISVSAYTGAQLRDAGITNLKDLGYQTPGVQIDQSSSAQIWIRGIGQRDDGARLDSPVGVYIDGLYIPRKDGQLMDLMDVQSVQVLRGPQGTLFGKNTTAGAILVTTNGPEDELSGFVDTRLGNYNRADFKASANVPLIGDTLLSKVTFSSVNRDGYQHNVTTGQDTASEDRNAGALQLRWNASDDVTADFMGYYGRVREKQASTNCRFMHGSSYNDQDSLFGNRILPGDTTPVDGFNDNTTPVRPGFVAQSQTYQDACEKSEALTKDYQVTSDIPIAFNLDNTILGLTVYWDIHEDLSLKSITGYSDQKKFGNAGNPDNDATHLPISARYRKDGSPSKREHWSQEFQLNGVAFNEKLDYTFGLFAMEEKIDDGTDTSSGWSTGDFIPDQNVLVVNDPNAEQGTYELTNTTYAAFFQGSYDVTDNLEFTAGVRWTSEKRESNVKLNLLDQDAFKSTALASLAGVPGINASLLIPGSPLILLVDPDVIFAQDIFTTINAQFPHDADGQPIYQLIPAEMIKPDIQNDASETWDEVTPMASLAYHFDDDWVDNSFIDNAMVYFTYAGGFKSGTFEPIGIDGQATVEPEKVENFEVGFKINMLDDSMRLNGAIFRTNFDDMQLRQVVLDSGGTPRVVLRNASKTRIDGMELEWMWSPIPNLLLIATGSYNDYQYLKFEESQLNTISLLNQQPLPVSDRSNEPFAEVPKQTYSLAVQYTFETEYGAFTPRLDYSYTDDIFMGLDAGAGQHEDQSTFDSYGLINARIGWISANGHYEAAVYGTNITDELYYMGAAAVGDSTGNFMVTTAPPRMYGLELRYNFF